MLIPRSGEGRRRVAAQALPSHMLWAVANWRCCHIAVGDVAILLWAVAIYFWDLQQRPCGGAGRNGLPDHYLLFIIIIICHGPRALYLSLINLILVLATPAM